MLGNHRNILCLIPAIILFHTNPVHADPQGHDIRAGAASISSSGTVTTIDQTSNKLVVNWNEFGIAENETVTFAQPDATSIALTEWSEEIHQTFWEN